MRQLLLATLPGLAATGVAGNASWEIASRNLPAPVGASPQIQAAIAAQPVPDVAARRASGPANDEEWRRLIAYRAAQQATDLNDLAKRVNASITRDEIAGVTGTWPDLRGVACIPCQTTKEP